MNVRTFLVLALFAPTVAISGCSSAGGESDPSSQGPDGEDAVSGEALSQGAANTAGFVTPNVTPDEAAAIVANYPALDPDHKIANNLLDDAIVYYDVNKSHIKNLSTMSVVDFGLNSGKFRFFVIDMTTGEVTPHKVAHGAGSESNGNGMAVRFSNVDGSHESSLGFALGSEVYDGVHGRSLRLDGLSKTNSALRPRAIVIHGAAYVHESNSSRQGNSFGCFALDMDVKDEVIDAMKNGGLLYAGLGQH